MLYTVFSRISDMFVDISYFEVKDSFNSQAGQIYSTNLPLFVRNVAFTVEKSQEQLYNREQGFSLKVGDVRAECL